MHIMHKVNGAADASQTTSGVNSILPVIQLIVVPEGEKISLMKAGFQNQTVWSCVDVDTFDVGDVMQFDDDTGAGTLKGVKVGVSKKKK